MKILGIETSCDETGIAFLDIVDDRVTIRAERLSSQVALHANYGGVVPELASREHLKALPLLIQEVLQVAGELPDGIAVTRGPGLKGCLLTGIEFAKGLCAVYNIPLIGVNHLEGHLWSPGLSGTMPQAPYLALIVSGGHTEIVHVEGIGAYTVLARTIDDAAGEAFDKAAFLLGCPYPGGAALSKIAQEHAPRAENRFKLPKVMREAEGFSFSGLKTAIAQLIQQNPTWREDSLLRGELCWAIQESIVDALVYKVQKAIHDTGTKTVVVTGGVSANTRLRERIRSLAGCDAIFPHPSHCTDNGAMIALAGGIRARLGERSELSMTAVSRWPLEEMRGVL
jgi:N6-L-threonylcarbamoyladenine synthase